MDRCRDWTAVHDHMPPGPKRLTVRGICTFPRGGYTAKLRALRRQGINPRDLLMKLVIHEPEAGPTAVTEVEVLYRKNTENEFDTVTITSVETTSAGVPSIKVTHPR
jgi:hypothetical protein